MSDLTNIIEVSFGESKTVYIDDAQFQYNSGVYIKFVDIELPETYQVHFSNSRSETSLEMIGTADGVLVPYDVWESGKTIFAWIYLHPTEDSAVTEYEVQIAKRKRSPLPDDAEPTPSQQSAIDQAIVAMNNVAERATAMIAEIQDALNEVTLQVEAMKEATTKLNSLVFNINSGGELEYTYEEGGE
jgi:hypothetical protein